MMTQHTANTLIIQPGRMTLAELRQVWQQPMQICLDDAAYDAIHASVQAIEQVLARDVAAYGINTGFGLLAKKRIPSEQLMQLQRNLILSHSVGTGEALSPEVVRLILLMKIASLARGYSGIRAEVIDSMIAVFNAGITPLIPAKGSVGASGDLAPLSHMTLAIMGEGQVFVNGALVDAKAALAQAGIAPVVGCSVG